MPKDAIPPGTLHLLILRTLARDGEQHGFEIAESIERLSSNVLTVEEGSLYPAVAAFAGERVGHSRVGHDWWQPPRAVLPADQGRA